MQHECFDAKPCVLVVVNIKEGRLWLALSRFHVLDLFSRGCCWTYSCIVGIQELSASDFPLHIQTKSLDPEQEVLKEEKWKGIKNFSMNKDFG